MTDKLIDRIKAYNSAPTIYDAPDPVRMAERILADADTIERWRSMWEKEQSHNEQLIEALKAADELAVVANNTGCATQEDADKLRAKAAAQADYERHILSAIEYRQPTVQEAAWVLADVVKRRAWTHYPIEMPLTEEGAGPAKVGVDAHCTTYEVWDAYTFRAISNHNNLPDAIASWLRALAEGDNQ